MADDRWDRLNQLVHDALEQPESEREAFIRRVSGGDRSLCDETLSLVRRHKRAEGFLEVPVVPGSVSPETPISAGTELGPYRIAAPIGEGGMGIVYRARDSKLRRTVAIKVLAESALPGPEQRERFVREARAASALNHPNIIAIYDIDTADGRDFIAMEFVAGAPLQELIPPQGMPVDQALELGMQLVRAMAAAHATGLVHRDIKPANVIVTDDRHIKVIDFGLAKVTRAEAPELATPTLSTQEGGAIGGTPGYAAPEQIEGQPIDARADVFAIGAVLYEMLAGRRAFTGTSTAATLASVHHDTPQSLGRIRRDVPRELERIVARCLEKYADARYASAEALLTDLQKVQSQQTAQRIQLSLVLRRPAVTLTVAAVVFAVLATGTWVWWRQSQMQRVRAALDEAERLSDDDEFDRALRLILDAEGMSPDDPAVRAMKGKVTGLRRITTQPDGAHVRVKGYGQVKADWLDLGTSPIHAAIVPQGFLRWRITKEGYETLDAATRGNFPGAFNLWPIGEAPEGMVFIPGEAVSFFGNREPVNDFWIDRYEVSNREFKRFVDARGYARPEFWSWDRQLTTKTLGGFTDTTGRPGPATWEAGSYRSGEADYPVTGVSWYEASAYARFSGKALPTVYEWTGAAGNQFDRQDQVAKLSNYSDEGPAPRGKYSGLSTWGVYDAAGNAREWTLNPTERGTRYVLGGAWDDPRYLFWQADAAPALDRNVRNGFRCIIRTAPLQASQSGAVKLKLRDFAKEVPASDRAFRGFRDFYPDDPARLNWRIESSDDTPDNWRDETVLFDAPYQQEQVKVHVLLPKLGKPPYQAILYFPGDGAQWNDRIQRLDYLLTTGRAVVFPFLRGYYGRGRLVPFTKEHVFEWYQDIRRTLDYLETRNADIDSTRFGYLGLSRGGMFGPVLTALEPRFKASVLIGGGFDLTHPWAQEIDPFNFTPRVRVPTCMLHGRDDPTRPFNTSARMMFEALTALDDKHKRLIPTDSGHLPTKKHRIEAVLRCFDDFLGPVNR